MLIGCSARALKGTDSISAAPLHVQLQSVGILTHLQVYTVDSRYLDLSYLE